MPLSRQKLFARVLLGAFVAICALWLGRLDYTRKISTNVLDLIPTAEQSPEVDLVRSFASDVQSRVMLFALSDSAQPGTAPTAAAGQFAKELSGSAAFAEVSIIGNSADQDELGRRIFERRFELLLPTWLAEHQREYDETGQPAAGFSKWLAERAASDLEEFLTQPEASALQKIIQSDPLLLVPRLLDDARLAGPTDASGTHALIWAKIKDSPLAEAGQQPVFNTITKALANVRANHPGTELRWSGVNRFAAASRARIESEISLLNLFSIAAVL
ncbi:MAG: hypothetical protein ABIV50_15155, partial [Opitutus sp.]